MTIDCGIILYKDYGDRIRFLLAKDRVTGKTGFIKGALEFGETEKEAAVREITYSTGINVNITDDFRTEYIQGNSENKKKKIVMFLAQYSEKVIKIPEECSFRTVNLEFAEAMKQLDNPVKQGFIDEYIQQLSLEVEDLNFILNVFKQPLSNMEYCYLMQASILKNYVDDVRKLIGMSPYKDSNDILVTSQIAEGVKFIRKNRKPWEK